MFIFLLLKSSVKNWNLFPVIFISTLFSCKTIRVTESPGGHMTEERKQYIEKYNKLAISEMKRAGVPASITLAQGILESDNGTGRLAKKANNHFGIKCHDNWKGEKFIMMMTGEKNVSGNMIMHWNLLEITPTF